MCILCLKQASFPGSRLGTSFVGGGRRGLWAVGFAAGLVGATVLQASSEAGIRVELRSSAEVSGEYVRFGDIASISGPNDDARRHLEALSLGRAPIIGESVRLDRSTLQRWVQSRVGRTSSRISWTGSPEIRIQSAMQPLSGERVAGVALEAVKNGYAKTSFRSDVRLAEEIRAVSVPTGNIELKVRNQGEPTGSLVKQVQPTKRQVVWVDVWVGKRFVRSMAVGVIVSLVAPAYVAARNLSAGEVISPEDLVVKELEWTGRTTDLIEAPHGVPADERLQVDPKVAGRPRSNDSVFPSGLRMRHALSAGEPLTRVHVESMPLVSKGQLATLRAIQGAIELESRVEVLQDGGLGQTVRVKAPRAGHSFPAKVSGAGVVEVLP